MVVQAQLAVERVSLEGSPLEGPHMETDTLVLGDLALAHPLVLSPVVQAQLAGEMVSLEGPPLVAGAGIMALGDLAVAHPHHDSKLW